MAVALAIPAALAALAFCVIAYELNVSDQRELRAIQAAQVRPETPVSNLVSTIDISAGLVPKSAWPPPVRAKVPTWGEQCIALSGFVAIALFVGYLVMLALRTFGWVVVGFGRTDTA